MATQIITRQLCDYCQHDDETDNPASERYLVAISGDEYEVDLCEKHRKPLLDLVASLSEVARKVPRRGRPPANANGVATADSTPCPVCDKPFANRSGLGAHTRKAHGQLLAELEGKPLNYPCTECDQAFASAAALGVHKRVHST